MKINYQIISLEKGGKIVIQENPDGRIYIECDKVLPVVIVNNAGIPGVCGPHLEFDMEQHVEQYKAESIKCAFA